MVLLLLVAKVVRIHWVIDGMGWNHDGEGFELCGLYEEEIEIRHFLTHSSIYIATNQTF